MSISIPDQPIGYVDTYRGGYFHNQLSLPRLMGVRMSGAHALASVTQATTVACSEATPQEHDYSTKGTDTDDR